MAALTAIHAILLVAVPSAAVIALGIWWNSNTVSHNFIHRPFFRSRISNSLFALWLTVLLGYPQSLWRERHLAHHAGVEPRVRFSRELVFQMAALGVLWATIAVRSPEFLALHYAPGWLLGLGMCAVHGYYEHARGVTSHYGRLYNTLCFNDGFHTEHHAKPGTHWTDLGSISATGAVSAWPAPLRWLEAVKIEGALEALEKVVMRAPFLQRWMIESHRQAFRVVLGSEVPRRVAIVGGGLFPRTALILRELLPHTELTLIDSNREHLDLARKRMDGGVRFVNARHDPQKDDEFDMIVIPLSYRGNRETCYQQATARMTIIHDWLWRRRGFGCRVSVALLKRLNVVMR